MPISEQGVEYQTFRSNPQLADGSGRRVSLRGIRFAKDPTPYIIPTDENAGTLAHIAAKQRALSQIPMSDVRMPVIRGGLVEVRRELDVQQLTELFLVAPVAGNRKLRNQHVDLVQTSLYRLDTTAGQIVEFLREPDGKYEGQIVELDEEVIDTGRSTKRLIRKALDEWLAAQVVVVALICKDVAIENWINDPRVTYFYGTLLGKIFGRVPWVSFPEDMGETILSREDEWARLQYTEEQREEMAHLMYNTKAHPGVKIQVQYFQDLLRDRGIAKTQNGNVPSLLLTR